MPRGRGPTEVSAMGDSDRGHFLFEILYAISDSDSEQYSDASALGAEIVICRSYHNKRNIMSTLNGRILKATT
eukprot:4957670-Pyramimonas_sp.AAC.1